MSKLASPFPVVVEHITDARSGKYGPYRSVLFVTNSGEKIWKSFDPSSVEIANLSVGMSVHLVETSSWKGKASHHIILPGEPVPVPDQAKKPAGERPAHQHSAVMSPARKQEIAAYVEQMAALYGFCHDAASRTFAERGFTGDVRSVATTLFISAQRQFGI